MHPLTFLWHSLTFLSRLAQSWRSSRQRTCHLAARPRSLPGPPVPPVTHCPPCLTCTSHSPCYAPRSPDATRCAIRPRRACFDTPGAGEVRRALPRWAPTEPAPQPVSRAPRGPSPSHVSAVLPQAPPACKPLSRQSPRANPFGRVWCQVNVCHKHLRGRLAPRRKMIGRAAGAHAVVNLGQSCRTRRGAATPR